MARAISSRRSRGTFGRHLGTERDCHGRGTLGVGRGRRPGGGVLGPEGSGRRSARRDRRRARAQRSRLEPWGPGRLHERLRSRLAHQLRHGRPRAVRVAKALRPLRGHLLCRSEEHTSELQSPYDLVCRLLLEKKNMHYTLTTKRINLQLTNSAKLKNKQ